MTLCVRETWIRKEPLDNEYGGTEYRNLIEGESDVYETKYDTAGALFRGLQKDAGRCVGRIYHDDHGPIGWVFEKKTEYEDTGEPYLLETWVTVHTALPTRTVKYHYYGKENK